jgi:hypothetical protein
MKKAVLVITIFLTSFQSMQAQWWKGGKEVKGNGEMTTQTRNVSNYDHVALTGSLNVELIAGKEGKIKVEAEENLQEYILTTVKDDKLVISVEKGFQITPSRNKSVRITVPFESIDAVTLTGSGDIHSQDEIKSEKFKIGMTGSGDITLVLKVKNLRTGLTGSGDITLSGTAQDFDCQVTGSGDISAFDLKCETVSATVTGSGDLQVYASKEIKASVPGSGDIEYKGNPKKKIFKTTGSGGITKR